MKEQSLNENYQACRLCPRECGVNRHVHTGYCGCGDVVKAARAGLHYYEEPFLSGTRGSGTVFFSGCSLGCVYCQNTQISRDRWGLEITEERLAQIFLEQQNLRGAHNINLVTGTHFLPSIVTALHEAKARGLHIPVIWNSSGYEKPDMLRHLKGLVDIFLPDLKTLDPELAAKYMHAPDYPEMARKALSCMAEMAGDTVFCDMEQQHVPGAEQQPEYEGENVLMKRGLVVRHLVIPGHAEDSRHVLRYLHDTFGERIWISLMSQYTPVGKYAGQPDAEDPFPELYRTVAAKEYEEVVDYAIELGIEHCMIQEGDAAQDSFIPDFDGSGISIQKNENGPAGCE